jgi:hypothetical protein
MYQYCLCASKTPDQLIAERQDKTLDPDGYKSLDQAQQFILSGVIKTKKVYPNGRVFEKTIQISELSRKRRELLYAAIKSFYKHNRAALPAESFRITENHTAENAVEPKTTYMPLNDAKAAIAACKTPYRELFSCMMYGGLGRREVMLINNMWPRLKEELRSVKDLETPIKLSYNFRKKQEELAFFTFVPAKLLLPFVDEKGPWMVRVHGGKGRKEPMTGWHYLKPWHHACKVAQIKNDVIPHFFRDLMLTDGFVNVGIKQEYLQFMTGHTVDKNLYLQLGKKPEAVLAEWMKWRDYIESENPTLHKEIKSQAIELMVAQKQLAVLTESLRQSLAMQLRETVKLNELEKNPAKKKERQERIDQLEQQMAALDKAAEPIIVAKSKS